MPKQPISDPDMPHGPFLRDLRRVKAMLEPMSRERLEEIRKRQRKDDMTDPMSVTSFKALSRQARSDRRCLLAEVDRLREENERLKEALRD